MKIGVKISQLREENKISQQELADIMEVSRQTVSKWECGNSDPELSKIIKLASLFKVTTDCLLLSDNDETSEKLLEEKKEKVNELHKFYNYQKRVVENFYLSNPDFKQTENKLMVSQPSCKIILDVKKINNDTIFIPNIVSKVILSSNYQGKGLKIEIEDTIENLAGMFKGRTISTLNLNDFDTTKVKSLQGFLSGFKSIDLICGVDKLDLSKHTTIKELFKDSTIGEIENINNMNVSNIEDFTSVFSNCKINKLDISNWKISNLKSKVRTKEESVPMSSYIFHRATIDELNVTNWDLSNVKHTIAWFAASKINKLHDITNWDMSNVVDCSGMFNSAIIKDTCDLNKMKITSKCNINGMFDLYKN